MEKELRNALAFEWGADNRVSEAFDDWLIRKVEELFLKYSATISSDNTGGRHDPIQPSTPRRRRAENDRARTIPHRLP